MKKIHSFDEVYDAQKLYRILLSALSNPTKILDINPFTEKLFGCSPAFLALAMTLLDNEVTFSTCDHDSLAGDIVSLTLARQAPLEVADFVFVTNQSSLPEVIARVKCGTLRDPHKSATLIVGIGDGRDTHLRLSGPGIAGIAEFRTSPAVLEALRLRDAQGYEYPQGIDFIFICGNGELFALPRLTHMEV